MDHLTTIHEIVETPLAYISEIIEREEPNYTMMMYGPYLIYNYTKEFQKRMKDIRNETLRFLTVIGIYCYISRGNYTFARAKDKILYLIKNCSDGEYHDIIVTEGVNLMERIRQHQKETSSVESAILNYAPLVAYAPTMLVKPEMEKAKSYTYDVSINDIDERINTILKTKYYDILVHNEICFKGGEIAKDIESLIKMSSAFKEACLYFIYVYLRYGIEDVGSSSGSMEFFTKKNAILKIVDNYDNLNKGGSINVSEMMTAYENILQ